MGSLKTQLEQYGEAEDLLQEAISTARRIRDRWRLAQALESLGECFQKQSKLNEAASELEEACLLWQQQSLQEISKQVASTLVELKTSQRDWDAALFWHDHILAICRQQKQHSEMAGHLEGKGETLVVAQRYDEAALHFEAAIATCEESGYSWRWSLKLSRLCAIPKTAIKWERRLQLLCDVKKLQRRIPQLVTAGLKLPIPGGKS
ncbi:hypothetical protein M407DRAFT_166321 [Tulasnella calospora MUT 4182]|uniref:Uncharacterized protein n=1 Tax=Tulasnella calospora MUT 4182 TaxID=1051891 RepID=A0A0C3LIZ8_9AGAM|nr:hypothetical protein M407DRAFT_166321 [Tulasnella calospora MUT 4182]